MRAAVILRPVAVALAAAALLLLTIAAPAAATGTAGELITPKIDAADVRGYPDIELVVTAPAELAAAELDGRAFLLTEAGSFRRVEATRLPPAEQEIVLVIDVSGSMRGAAIDGARVAAGEFVQNAPAGTRIAVLAFSTDLTLVSPFTLDRAALLAGIDGLQAGGDTALFDAVIRAAELAAESPTPTETIIVLSDGDDTASLSTIDEAGDRVAAADGSFFGLQLTTAGVDPAELAALVEVGAGSLVTADNAAGLTEAYRTIAVNSGNRYTVTYRSAERGPTEVVVTVTAGGVQRSTDPYVVDLPRLVLVPSDPVVGGAAVRLGWLASPLGLILGLLAFCAALALIVFGVVPAGPRRLAADRLVPLGGAAASRLSGSTDRVSGLIGRVLGGRWSPFTAASLEQAGVAMRLQDALLILASVTLATIAAALVVAGPVLAALLAVAVPFAAKAYIGFRAGRRRAKFADQLDDTLQLIASSLRAGHSLLRAVDAVARDAEPPTSTEFARIINETRLGRDLGLALDDTSARMGSEDFLWVAQAVAIHREVGGNLAEVLDQVGETIRERNQIRRQVKALSAEGKLSAFVLMALPIGVVGFLSLTNPSYMAGFTKSLLGYLLMGVAVTLMLVGALWLRKVVTFKF